MDETAHEPLMTWRFIRVTAVRIVIGAVLVAAVSVAVFVWMPYQREQGIARRIEALGGRVSFRYCGPNWVPQSFHSRLRVLRRIHFVDLSGKGVPSDVLSELGLLPNLHTLVLNGTQSTDAELKHLMGLTSLTHLFLHNTKVTDAGLKYVNGLASLERLNVENTHVTAEGRAFLRRAIPNCKIEPDP